jgi:hypothetical protein
MRAAIEGRARDEAIAAPSRTASMFNVSSSMIGLKWLQKIVAQPLERSSGLVCAVLSINPRGGPEKATGLNLLPRGKCLASS